MIRQSARSFVDSWEGSAEGIASVPEPTEGPTRESDADSGEDVLREVMSERVKALAEAIGSNDRPISQLLKPYGQQWNRWRCRALWIAGIGTALVGVNCLVVRSPLGIVAAPLVILAGVALATLILGEIQAGSGTDIETEWKSPRGLYRTYEFEATITRLEDLGLNLSVSLSAVVFGYAEVYRWISDRDPPSFSQSLSGFDALYFSVVTFATVGFGDIVPSDTETRLLVSAQILFGLFLIGIGLAASVSWMIGRLHESQSDRRERLARRTARREAAMRQLGLGLYSTIGAEDNAAEPAATDDIQPSAEPDR